MTNNDIIRKRRTSRIDADALGDVTSGWDTSTPDQILENLETWKNLAHNMKVLELTLNKKWFDLIEKGVKTEEYREVKRYWIARLMSNIEYATNLEGLKIIGRRFKHFDLVRFSNGYSKSSRRITMEFQNISIGQGLPEWGAVEGQEYFVIKIGREVGRQNC